MTTLSPGTSRFVQMYDSSRETLSFDSISLKYLAATSSFSGSQLLVKEVTEIGIGLE
jgi:hypothetical protein